MGLWDSLTYDVKDLFTTSHAESKRSYYKKLISDMKDYLDDLDGLEDVLDFYQGENDYYANNSECYKGKFNDTFMDQLSEFDTRYSKIDKAMRDAKADIKTALALFQERYTYWDNECAAEDRREEEYSASHYDEIGEY